MSLSKSLAVFSILLTSCIFHKGPAYTVDDLEVSKELTLESIRNRKPMVGFMVRSPEVGKGFGIGETQKLTRSLKKNLSNGSSQMFRDNTVMKKLGWASNKMLMKSYSEDGELSEKDFVFLDSKLGDDSYLLLARVIIDKVDRSKDSQVIEDEDGWKLSIRDENITLSTINTTTVEYKIYDIQIKKPVWSGEITKTASSSKFFQLSPSSPVVSRCFLSQSWRRSLYSCCSYSFAPICTFCNLDNRD